MKPNQNSGSLTTSLHWSPDDKELLVCFSDQCPKIVDPISKKILREINFAGIMEAIENGDSQTQATPSSTDSSKKGDGENVPRGPLAVWSTNGLVIAVAAGSTLHLIDKETWQDCYQHHVAMRPPTADKCLEFFAKDSVISRLPPTGSKSELAAKIENYFLQKESPIQSLCWSANDCIAIGTPLGAYLWNPKTDEIVQSFHAAPIPGELRTPVFSAGGHYLAAVFVPDIDMLSVLYWNLNKSLNVTRPLLQIWNAKTGEPAVRYQGVDVSEGKRIKLYWSKDDRMIAWSKDNQVIIFDLWKQATRVLLRTQDHVIQHMAWSPSANRLAIFDSSDGIVVYDALSGVRTASFREASWGRYKDIGPRAFAWSNSGHALAVSSMRTNVDVWRLN